MDPNSLLNKFRKYISIFIAKQVNPPPFIFLTIYIYREVHLESSDYLAYTLFISGLIFAIAFKYNHFYYYSPILNTGIGYWSIFNLFLGILAANQKWKLYLYIFVIGDSLTQQYPQISSIYLICCTLLIWLTTYNNLIFRNISDNIIYFTAFFTIFVYEVVNKLIIELDGNPAISYFTVPFAATIGYKLINSKIEKLKKTKLSKLRNAEMISHYISLIREEIKSPYSREGYLQTHRDLCADNTCFCRNSYLLEGQISDKFNFGQKVEYFFIRHLYEQSIQNPRIPEREFLVNKFIEFLIQNNQITQAIERYYKLDSFESVFIYFRWVERTRIFSKIQDKLNESNYFNVFSKQFIYAFEYDNSYLYLASEIKEILKQKVSFWKEVGRQNPLMVKLQKVGSEIVQRMYNLNHFYYQEIKEQEEKINNFNGTIMYAMYLLSTTNYKEFAESLIKNTSRTLESIKIHEDNIAETYGLRVIIRDTKRSCNEKVELFDIGSDGAELERFIQETHSINSNVSSLQKLGVKKNHKQFYADGFVEIISNISGSLCKLLKTSKNDIIGQDLNCIIPVSYQERHHSKLQKLLNFNGKTNKELVSLSFINKIRLVPLKTRDGKLITAKVSVKIYEQIDDGLSFVALVQTVNENKVTIITSIDGEVEEYEQGLGNMKILEHEQIVSVLYELKQEWKTNQTITQRKINITYNQNSYSICFSSPYQYSFLDKNFASIKIGSQSQQLISQETVIQGTKNPPIHIDLTNQSSPMLFNPKQNNQQQMTKCIKKIQSVFYKTDIDSQASTNSNRKNSIVSVLMTFSENHFIPFYNYIMAIFGLVLTITIIGNLINFTFLTLDWDNSVEFKNPIINLIKTMRIRGNLIQAVNYQLDLIEYEQNPLINLTKVNQYYGLHNSTYPDWVKANTRIIQRDCRGQVSSTIMAVADILTEAATQLWSIEIPTPNLNNPNPEYQMQQIPVQNIFMNYLVDLDLLAKGKSYESTIISLNFWESVQYILCQMNSVATIVSESIDKTIIINIVFLICIAVVVIVSLIPIYILLKKRVKKHIDIYDLIASVESDQIRQQIHKLSNIIQITNNSNQSSQVLKANTINYLARKRSSTSSGDNGLGGSNEMIEGLVSNENKQKMISSIFTKNNDQVREVENINTNTQSNFFNIQKVVGILADDNDELRLRKRQGQIDIKGSQADLKTIVWKHFILYFIIILSLFSLFIITISKINHFRTLSNDVDRMKSVSLNTIEESLLLLNTKKFYRGMSDVSVAYHDTNFSHWLQQNVYLNSAIKLDTKLDDSKILPICDGSNYDKNTYLFCQKNYSLTILRTQMDDYIKQAYQARLALEQKYNTSPIPSSQLLTYSQEFFYIQTLSTRIINITTTQMDSKLSQMLVNANTMNNNVQIYMILGLGVCGMFFLIGLLIINYMKTLYFKEIIIVSFLNTDMISKNKRVQSFLETLSRVSY